MAGNRIFVINNGRVVEDGASLGRLKSSEAGATAMDDHKGLVSILHKINYFSTEAIQSYQRKEKTDRSASATADQYLRFRPQ